MIISSLLRRLTLRRRCQLSTATTRHDNTCSLHIAVHRRLFSSAPPFHRRPGTVERRRIPATYQPEVPIADDGTKLELPVYSYATDPHTLTNKTAFTPLAEVLTNIIKQRGALSVAEFMQECLQNVSHGYYMTKKDMIGGDFITSPEVSQMFGECMGAWIADVIRRLNSPKNVHIVECGPGRGTLLLDVIRVLKRLTSNFTIHCLESSPLLMQSQINMLDVTLDEQYKRPVVNNDNTTNISDPNHCVARGRTSDGVAIEWHDSFRSLPTDDPVIFICHEFFDALPVFQFERRNGEWCEILVDIDSDPSTPHHFKFVMSAHATATARALLSAPTLAKAMDGTRMEVNIGGMTTINDIAIRIGKQRGVALIIDYGYVDRRLDDIHTFTLQSVKNHQHVHPLSEPGVCDLTTLVDFGALTAMVQRTQQLQSVPIAALPVTTQNEWLRDCGIAARLSALAESVDDEAADRLVDDATRLVETGEGKMGSFKVMCVTHADVGVPAGWNLQEQRIKDIMEAAKSISAHDTAKSSSVDNSSSSPPVLPPPLPPQA